VVGGLAGVRNRLGVTQQQQLAQGLDGPSPSMRGSWHGGQVLSRGVVAPEAGGPIRANPTRGTLPVTVFANRLMTV
jgi:hypothetical protein